MLSSQQENALRKALKKAQTIQGEYIAIDRSTCVLCGACVGVCPVNALSLQEEVISISSECIGCEACVDSCPLEAIKKI